MSKGARTSQNTRNINVSAQFASGKSHLFCHRAANRAFPPRSPSTLVAHARCHPSCSNVASHCNFLLGGNRVALRETKRERERETNERERQTRLGAACQDAHARCECAARKYLLLALAQSKPRRNSAAHFTPKSSRGRFKWGFVYNYDCILYFYKKLTFNKFELIFCIQQNPFFCTLKL